LVELNRAVAAGMAHGPLSGLMLLDQLYLDESLADHHSFHAARADLLRRAGYTAEAQTAYARALALCQNHAERRYVSRQIAELAARPSSRLSFASQSTIAVIVAATISPRPACDSRAAASMRSRRTVNSLLEFLFPKR
jgi:hypothetical protein